MWEGGTGKYLAELGPYVMNEGQIFSRQVRSNSVNKHLPYDHWLSFEKFGKFD